MNIRPESMQKMLETNKEKTSTPVSQLKKTSIPVSQLQEFQGEESLSLIIIRRDDKNETSSEKSQTYHKNLRFLIIVSSLAAVFFTIIPIALDFKSEKSKSYITIGMSTVSVFFATVCGAMSFEMYKKLSDNK